MFKTWMFIFGSLLVLVSWNCKRKTMQGVAKSPEPETVAEIVAMPDPGKPIIEPAPLVLPPGVEPELVASIRRTPCFGTCPVYEIKLYRDGTVHYTGRNHVARIGKYRSQVDRSFMDQLHRKAQELQYFSFQDRYPASGMINDLPLTVTYFRMGDQFKLINDYYDSPKGLQLFEKFLDDMFAQLTYTPLE